MNPLLLTKTAKFTVIASLSALLAFASKFNPKLQQFFIYIYLGTLVVLLIAALWEGRELVAGESSEDVGISSLIPSLVDSKPKRQYLLSPNVRLEIGISLAVITVAALIGAL